MISDEQNEVLETDEYHLPSLIWAAAYLTLLAWGGQEEGGWWFEDATLVTAPEVYVELEATPTCCFSEAEAEQVAERMRSRLPALNEGRPALSSVLSCGLYDVRVVRIHDIVHIDCLDRGERSMCLSCRT